MRAPFTQAITRGRRRALAVAALSIAAFSSSGAVGAQRDEVRQYFFAVEIGGMPTAMFREVSGLAVETEVLEFRDGGDSGAIRKLPGRTKYPNVVLKRGFTGDLALFDWAMMMVRTGNVDKKAVSIAVLDQGGTEIARWHLQNAWPAKWEGPTLKASGNEVAIESIELAHEGLSLDDGR